MDTQSYIEAVGERVGERNIVLLGQYLASSSDSYVALGLLFGGIPDDIARGVVEGLDVDAVRAGLARERERYWVPRGDTTGTNFARFVQRVAQALDTSDADDAVRVGIGSASGFGGHARDNPEGTLSDPETPGETGWDLAYRVLCDPDFEHFDPEALPQVRASAERYRAEQAARVARRAPHA